jgi:hypothetical protein
MSAILLTVALLALTPTTAVSFDCKKAGQISQQGARHHDRLPALT